MLLTSLAIITIIGTAYSIFQNRNISRQQKSLLKEIRDNQVDIDRKMYLSYAEQLSHHHQTLDTYMLALSSELARNENLENFEECVKLKKIQEVIATQQAVIRKDLGI